MTFFFTCFIFDLAAAVITMRPISLEPVNATLLMSWWSEMAAPAVGPYPGTRLITPGGKPACFANSQMYNAVRGVCSAGFITTENL